MYNLGWFRKSHSRLHINNSFLIQQLLMDFLLNITFKEFPHHTRAYYIIIILLLYNYYIKRHSSQWQLTKECYLHYFISTWSLLCVLIGHYLHDGVILLLWPQIFLFFLSYSNLVIPVTFQWQNPKFAQESKPLKDSGRSSKIKMAYYQSTPHIGCPVM